MKFNLKTGLFALAGVGLLAVGGGVGGIAGWKFSQVVIQAKQYEAMLATDRIPATEMGRVAAKFLSYEYFPKAMPKNMLPLQQLALTLATVCTNTDRCPDNAKLHESWGSSNYYSQPYVLWLQDANGYYAVVPAQRFKSDGQIAAVEPVAALYYKTGATFYRVNANGEMCKSEDAHQWLCGDELIDNAAELREQIIADAWKAMLRLDAKS